MSSVGGVPHNPVLETAWLEEQRDVPDALIAFAKLDAPHVEAVLQEQRSFPHVRGIRMALNFVEGCFGAERSPARCMVGSNCPPDSVFLSFDTIFDLLRKALIDFSPDEQHAIFYSNAKRLYRI